MTKRNKLLLSILAAAVIALLIALCFVGNTFARYTLNQSESVAANIAEWGVSLTTGEDGTTDEETHVTTYDVGTLKPYATDYTGTTARTSKSDSTIVNFVNVATLTNTGAVDATVSITADTDSDGNNKVTPVYQALSKSELSKGAAYGVTTTTNTTSSTSSNGTVYTYNPGSSAAKSTDTGYAGDYEKYGTDYADEVAEHFALTLMWSNSDSATADTASKFNYEDSTATDPTLKAAGAEDNEDTIYIYLDVEWISDLENENYDSDNVENGPQYFNGDGFDTWAGMWVSGFSFGLTIDAYQAS